MNKASRAYLTWIVATCGMLSACGSMSTLDAEPAFPMRTSVPSMNFSFSHPDGWQKAIDLEPVTVVFHNADESIEITFGRFDISTQDGFNAALQTFDSRFLGLKFNGVPNVTINKQTPLPLREGVIRYRSLAISEKDDISVLLSVGDELLLVSIARTDGSNPTEEEEKLLLHIAESLDVSQ